MRKSILKILQCNTNIHKMEFTYFINKLLWNLPINTIKVGFFSTGIQDTWILNKVIKK